MNQGQQYLSMLHSEALFGAIRVLDKGYDRLIFFIWNTSILGSFIFKLSSIDTTN